MNPAERLRWAMELRTFFDGVYITEPSMEDAVAASRLYFSRAHGPDGSAFVTLTVQWDELRALGGPEHRNGDRWSVKVNWSAFGSVGPKEACEYAKSLEWAARAAMVAEQTNLHAPVPGPESGELFEKCLAYARTLVGPVSPDDVPGAALREARQKAFAAAVWAKAQELSK